MWTLVQEYQPKVFGTASAFKAILQMENTFLWLIHFFFVVVVVVVRASVPFFLGFISLLSLFLESFISFSLCLFLYVCHSGMQYYIRVRKKHFHFPSTLYHTDSQNMHSHTRMDKYCVHSLPQNESKLMNFHGKKSWCRQKKTQKEIWMKWSFSFV